MKKLLAAVAGLVICLLNIYSQTIMQSGSDDGYTEFKHPLNRTKEYGWCSVVYPKESIGIHGEITSLYFHWHWAEFTQTSTYPTDKQKIFIQEVPYSAFADASYLDTTLMTQVRSGYIEWANFGWSEIVLDVPFTYSGNGNLLIHYENKYGFIETDPNYVMNFYFDNTQSDNRMKYNYSDGSFPETNGTLSSEFPAARFGFSEGYDVGISTLGIPTEVPEDEREIYVYLKNYMSTTITSAYINWEINGAIQTVKNWTGSLPAGDSVKVNLGLYLLSQGIYDIKAWASDPNSMIDEMADNDTLETTVNVFDYKTSAVENGYSSALPIKSSNYTSWALMKYDKWQMDYVGSVSSIAYRVQDGVTEPKTSGTQRIYMIHNNDALTTDYVPNVSAMQLVFEGQVSYISGWNEIIFDTIFTYNGIDDVLIYVEYENPEREAPLNISFQYNSFAGDALYKASDLSLPEFGAATLVGISPNIRINYSRVNDAGVVRVISPEKVSGIGVNNVVVELKNYGQDTLKNVVINYQFNSGSVATYNYTGALAFNETAEITIGTESLTNQDYVLKCWTESPNGKTDFVSDNDTAEYDFFAGSPLAGTYTIGSGGDFETFNAAVDSMVHQGIESSVVFEVMDGLYYEQVTIPSIKGNTLANSISFISQSGDSSAVLLACDSTNYTLQLNDVNNISFEKITFVPDTVCNSMIEVNGSFTNLCFTSCVFAGNTQTSYLFRYAQENFMHLNISNSVFLNASIGIDIFGSGMIDGNILANIFSGQTNVGINFSLIDSILIDQNIFQSGRWAIQGNGKYNSITNNTIHKDCQGALRLTGTQNFIANNFFKGSGHPFQGTMLYLSTSNSKFYNNTVIKNDEQNLPTANIYADYIDFFNNIMINENGPIYEVYAGNDNCSYNHNAYSFITSQFSNRGDALNDWQTNMSQDANSFVESFNFIADDNVHTFSSLLDSAGTPLPDVITDIDGDLRNATHPDIGADEFDALCLEPLSGTYSLGASGVFTSVNDAVAALNFCGIQGDVTFEIEAGTYNTQLDLSKAISGNDMYSVTFISADKDSTAVMIEFNADSAHNYIINLESKQNISLQNLTLRALNAEYSRVIRIANNSTNNLIQNNIIQGASDVPEVVDYYANGKILNNCLIDINENQTICGDNKIKNNLMINGSYGVYAFNDDYSNNLSNPNIIEGNTIMGQSSGAILSYKSSPLSIISNEIHQVACGFDYDAIRGVEADSLIILGNKIILKDAAVKNLKINGINPGSKYNVANNFIYIKTLSENTVNGIYITNYTGELNFNTVHIEGENPTSFGLNSDQFGNPSIVNNIFANYAGGLALRLGFSGFPSELDHNLYYSSGENLLQQHPTLFKTLADFQAATTFDDNSYSGHPGFDVAESYVVNSVLLSDKGTAIAGIAIDIDGNTRDGATPDIGCYEFESLKAKFSLGADRIVCGGTDLIIKAGEGFDSYTWNTGSAESIDTISVVPINAVDTSVIVSVSLGAKTYTDTIVYTTSLPEHAPQIEYCTFEADSIELFAAPGYTYLWEKWGSFYDTTQVVKSSNSSTYELQTINELGCVTYDTIYLGRYYLKNDLSAYVDSTTCLGEEIVLHADPWDNNHLWMGTETATTYTITSDIAESVKVYCSWQEEVSIGNRLFTCGSSDTAIIHFEDCTNVNNKEISDILVYPNPCENILYIQSESMYSYAIMTLDGKVLQQSNSHSLHHEVSTTEYSSGVYLLLLSNDEDYLIRKIVIK